MKRHLNSFPPIIDGGNGLCTSSAGGGSIAGWKNQGGHHGGATLDGQLEEQGPW